MQIGVTGKGTEYILTRHKDAIRPIYLSPLAGEGEPACRSLGEGRGECGERIDHRAISSIAKNSFQKEVSICLKRKQ